MCRSQRAGVLAGAQVVGDLPDRPSGDGVGQRHIDIGAAVAGTHAQERGQDADRAPHSAAQIGDGESGLGQSALRTAGDAEQASVSLSDQVNAFGIAHRSVLAEARNRAVHQVRAVGFEVVVAQRLFSQGTHPEVLDEYIHPGRERTHHSTACLSADVDGEAAFAPVHQIKR
jgi:hypothetical protein